MDGRRYTEGYTAPLKESVLNGIRGELHAAVHAEFFINCMEMGFHGALADRELHGDLLVAQTGGNHLHDLCFAPRQYLDDLLRLFALRQTIERATDQRRLEGALSALHAANGIDEIHRSSFFQHKSR